MADKQVAWRVRLMGESGITAATTRGKAMLRIFNQAREAGYRVKFTDCRATRAPEYDQWAEQDKSRSVTDEHYFKIGWYP